MLKKSIIILLSIYLFSINIHAIDNKNFQEVYIEDTEEIYLIEKSNIFSNLEKPVVAIALGGGGARGFVNVGALIALEEEQIPIDMITGTSMGAIVAVLYGSGLPLEEIEKLISPEVLLPAIDINFPFTKSFLTSRKLNYILQEIAPFKRLEDFPIPTAILSLDLTKEACIVQTKGDLKDIVKGSYAIPFIFPVAKSKGSYLIDPGVFELIPARTAKLLGADIVISITAFDKLPYTSYDFPFRAWIKMINIIKAKNSKRIVDEYSDVILENDVGDYSYLDFSLAQKFIEIGYKKTKEKIPQIKKLLKKNNIPNRKYEYNFYHKENNINNVEDLINDIKNNRLVYDFVEIAPIINYGDDFFQFSKGYFTKRLDSLQYGFKLGYKNNEIITRLEKGNNDKFEIVYRLKKMSPTLDIQFLYNNDKNRDLYDLLLLNYKKHYTTGAGMTMINNESYLHFNNKYNFKLKNIEVNGKFNLLHPLNSSFLEDSEGIWENECIFPLSSNKDICVKAVMGQTNHFIVPDIYRGISPERSPYFQGSVELRNDYNFTYSYNILELFQIPGLDVYQFIDNYSDYKQKNFAIGTGMEVDINIFGIKPITFNGYLSYDIEREFYQSFLGINISL